MIALLLAAAALTPAPTEAHDEPVTAAYYYKVRWGFQDEFERLFLKNHYPVLRAQVGGRIRNVHMFKPTFHGDGRADWTFLVVITFSNWQAFYASGEEEAVVKRLFPDQETFEREERRRFEILEAHWDVPLTPVRPPGGAAP
jgi:hypothetical protein